jgi:hypothetical protein
LAFCGEIGDPARWLAQVVAAIASGSLCRRAREERARARGTTRHAFAFALRAGISTFDLSHHIGASLTMIDRPLRPSRSRRTEHPIGPLDDLSARQRPRWTLVDAAWTPTNPLTACADNENIS